MRKRDRSVGFSEERDGGLRRRDHAPGSWRGARDPSSRRSRERTSWRGIRAEEAKITAVERLRWSGEMLVSVGRGYLVSGEPGLLPRLEEVTAEFESSWTI